MKRLRYPALSLFALVPCTLASAAGAQTWSTVPQQSDADRLATAMRTLGSNPQHLESLITAGELSLRLGDAAGAAALFARADKVDPRNGRVKAGMGSILVHEERPGEALRYFNMAEGYGLDPARFAAERGLAYDLIGEQERAQRDYRVALRGGSNDEVLRRYALSLGISGKKDEALAQIDPLVRKNDRGAWRARAFVLAMSGDVADANKIATTMFPGGMAQGLSAFFERLPRLAVVDRAFAVHFGEVRPTPQRLADARLTPALAPLAPEPGRQAMLVSVAAVQPPAAPKTASERRREERERRRAERQQRVQLARAGATRTPPAATRTAAPVVTAAATTSAPGPVYRTPPRELAQSSRAVTSPASAIAAASVRRAPSVSTPTPTPSAVVSVSSGAMPAAALAAATRPAPAAADGTPAYPTETAAPAARSLVASAAPITLPATGPNLPASARPSASAAAVVAATSTSPATSTPTSANPNLLTTTRTAAAPTASVVTAATSSSVAPRVATAPSVRTAPARAVTPAPRPASPVGEDTILARIIAGISVPASELEARPTPVPVRVGAATRAAAAPIVAAKPTTRAKPAPVELADAKPVTRKQAGSGRAVAAEPAEEPAAEKSTKRGTAKQAADAKAADTKAAASKKAAAAKKPAAKKADEDTSRIWVQVAGGANEKDLSKAWRAQQGKATALKGRDAYTTPLRATNRVVTGPFKTDAEARAFVNTLAKQGVSAFSFTSEKGQKMTKMSAK